MHIRDMATLYLETTNWKWESKIIKITAGNTCTVNDLLITIKKLELEPIRTLHIYVDSNILRYVIDLLIDEKYIFRAYIDGSYQYYKWLLPDIEDKVHPYATSTAGASSMILSPDELSVLLIYENSNWKFVTGSNDFRELSFDTAQREMFEEVGLHNDPDFIPKVIGVWNISGRFGGNINDVMTCYVFKAKMDFDIKMDEFELCDAQWFKISDLQPIIDLANNFDCDKNADGPINSHVITYNGQNFGYPYMLWLGNWVQKKYFSMNIVGNVNILV